jgi:hypothetical protein
MPAIDFFLDDNDRRMEDEWRSRENATERDMERVRGSAPTADDLTPEYTMEDPYAASVRGPERSELGFANGEDYYVQEALRGLQQQAQQGFTPAEQQMMEMGQRQQAQMARSQRDALAQQAEARGMGGSGLSYLAQQQAGEAATGQLSDYQTQMAMQAQQRALQGMQAYGALGSQFYGQSFDQDATRRSAIDDFNRWQTEYRRDVEGRNAGRRDRTAEGRAGATQQAWENDYRGARDQASDRGTYGNAVSNEQRYQQQRDDERMQGYMDMASNVVGGAGGGGGG